MWCMTLHVRTDSPEIEMECVSFKLSRVKTDSNQKEILQLFRKLTVTLQFCANLKYLF